ncbi:MAG: alkaline phosphatase family protein, partial [Chloroflexota bacterium]|nr:alkaline phosphatase family protein [Chloroflexota bacterium]
MTLRFPDGELGTWACLSDVTDRAVRIWLRAPEAGPRSARLLIDGKVVARAELTPLPEHDWVAADDIVLDRPVPNARFSLEVAGIVRHGRLGPTPGTPATFSFAFASCHQPFKRTLRGRLATHAGIRLYPSMARVLREHDARFVNLVGDQVYSDGVEPLNLGRAAARRDLPPSERTLLEWYRRVYRGYFNQRGFRALLEEWPTHMIWDDHDIIEGWGSLLRPTELDHRLFRAASTAYREYQHVRTFGADVDAAPPYHYCFWFGDVGFFVLDLRGERDYRAGRVIGERQWGDLDDFLRTAAHRGVPTVFVIASVPLVHLPPTFDHLLEWVPTARGTDVRDRWAVWPSRDQRDRLLERLFTWQDPDARRQAILLSGDVHAGAAFEISRPGLPGLVAQWTSSPLTTRTGPRHHLVNRIGTALANAGEATYRFERKALELSNNFGLVRVQPLSGGGHRAEFTLYGLPTGARDVRPRARVVRA